MSAFEMIPQSPTLRRFRITTPETQYALSSVRWKFEKQSLIGTSSTWETIGTAEGVAVVDREFPDAAQYRVSLAMQTPLGGTLPTASMTFWIREEDLPTEPPKEEPNEPPAEEPPAEEPPKPPIEAIGIVEVGLRWLLQQDDGGKVVTFVAGAIFGGSAVYLYLTGALI